MITYCYTCGISLPLHDPIGSCLMSSVFISIWTSCLISGLISSIDLAGVVILLALVVKVVVDVAGAVLVNCVEPVVQGAVSTSTNVWGWLVFWLRLVLMSVEFNLSACNAACKFSNDWNEEHQKCKINVYFIVVHK